MIKMNKKEILLDVAAGILICLFLGLVFILTELCR